MKRALVAMLALSLFVVSALAQSNTGRLVGIVSSPDGAIPGATVVVTDNQTGREKTITTSDVGAFTVPLLDPGTYTVKVTATGFKTFTASDVKIDTGREYSLTVTLEVGNIAETVTVSAGADVLNATNAELSSTISPRQITELPLNGRNPLGLIQLQAGTASNSANATSINGQRPAATNITRDGINIQDNFIRQSAADPSGVQQQPSTDDTAEFTVTTQNSGAENGYGASQIQLTTPRGQSEFHGALYEFNRNSKFGANRFFNNANRVAKTFRNFNQFGGKVGGPIWKSRGLFFFTNYEKTIDRISASRTGTVLTQNARQGLFTYIDNSGATRTVNLFALGVSQINNPPAGTPPVPTGINSTIQSRILANMPAGNSTITGDQRVTTGYAFSQKNNSDNYSWTSRLDWDVSSKHSLNAIYQKQNGTLLGPFTQEATFSETPEQTQMSPGDFYAGSWRWIPTANFTNEVRGGYVRNFPSFPRTNPLLPYFFSLPLSLTNPESPYMFQGRKTKTYNFQDNAEYMWGNHSFRFGTVMNFFKVLRLNEGGAIPTYTLAVSSSTPQISANQFGDPTLFPGGIGTTDRSRANALFALLGGIVSSGSQTFNVPDAQSNFVPFIGFRQNYEYENYSFYFSDQWRVTPRLTLNLGLRYEIYPSTRETNGVIAEPIVQPSQTTEEALLDPNGGLQVAGTNVGGGKLFHTDLNNFAPVLSVAYQPEFKNKFLGALFPGGGRTVLRGGYRLSYFADEFLKGPSAEGDQNSGLRQNSTTGVINARPENLPSIPVPTKVFPRTFAQNFQIAGGRGNTLPPGVLGVDLNLQTASNHEYNFSIQREIGFQTAIEIRYVGAFSSNSTRYHDLNTVDITNNGFLASFLQAQQNALASQAERNRIQNDPTLTAAQRTARLAQVPVSGAFNQLVPGAVQVTGPLAPTGGVDLTGTGSLANSSNVSFLLEGRPGSLAQNYITLGKEGNIRFLRNPNVFLAGLLDNSARYNHNALQVEFRKRFSQGFAFQANYTFSKTLSDAPGTDQRRLEFELDPSRPELEYSRVDYDQTHIFNFNSIYELPFGQGKTFFTDAGPWLNRLVGGWQFNSILRIASGAPFSVVDPRATLNITSRSTRNPAFSNLSKQELKRLVGGVFRNPDGTITLADPSILDPNTKRASNGPGTAAFAGQVFFNVPAGQVGNVERNVFTGPGYFNIDASLFKNIQITERVRFQIRAEAFNLLNHTNFAITNQQRDINSATAFNITTTFAPRVIQFAGRLEF